jgi:exoribonuclease-2
MKDGLVRADDAAAGVPRARRRALPRGARVRVRITGTDLLTLDVHASVIARIDDAGTPADEPCDESEAEEAADSAGPLTLAIDVQDDERRAARRAAPHAA